MHVLVVMPNAALRGQVRGMLRGIAATFSRTYEYGRALAEQDWITDAIVWAKGLDQDAVDLMLYLRRLNPDVRLFVVAPERTDAVKSALFDGIKVEGYADEQRIDKVVRDVLSVPTIVERAPEPPKATHGSSAGVH